jgi:prevent-host-death family protein
MDKHWKCDRGTVVDAGAMSDLTLTQLEAIAGQHSTHSASEVKANWRAIVRDARQGEVIVTRDNRPEAVVLSVEHYAELKAAAQANDPLRGLREDFDKELSLLHTGGATGRLREVFGASPDEMAEAANAAASRVW